MVTKPTDEDVLEILERLRAEKSKRGLTNAQIGDILAEKGADLSDKTIKRIFKYGSTDTNFLPKTLETVTVALGLDLVNQRTNEALIHERNELEKELTAAKETVANMSKTLEAMGEQITSMRNVVRASETHTAEREAQIKQLNDQMAVQVRRLKRKDMFLHLFTVGTLTASISAFLMSTSGFMRFGWKK